MKENLITRRTTTVRDGEPRDLRVNFENVVKQGLLFKKGDLLKMYNTQYFFYLEKKDETWGVGPFLKYGRKGKNVSNCIDLGFGSGEMQGTLVVKNPNSRTKLKIVTPQLTLRLKAESKQERDQWSHAMLKEINKQVPGMSRSGTMQPGSMLSDLGAVQFQTEGRASRGKKSRGEMKGHQNSSSSIS